MTNPILEDVDRRAALARIVGLSAAPIGLAMLSPNLSADGVQLFSAAQAAGNPGAQPGQGNLVHIPAATAETRMIAEWNIGDVNNTSGPFKIAASKAAYPNAPPGAAHYEAKLYNFPWGSLRTLSFKKGGPIQHLITIEMEIYVIAGSATLTPIPGHPGPPVTVNAGDALFLPSGYLYSPSAPEDFVILQAYVGRTVREAKKSIVTQRMAVASDIPVFQPDGRPRCAANGAARSTMLTYAGEGNSIRVVRLSGGRSNSPARTGSDALIYVVKGRVRHKSGDQTVELAAGDCFRERVGVSGSWEPLEETMLIATDAPMTPGALPPVNT